MFHLLKLFVRDKVSHTPEQSNESTSYFIAYLSIANIQRLYNKVNSSSY